jgi:hypothetical protein
MFPVVFMKVISSNIGIFIVAYLFIPLGLAFAGPGSLARDFLLIHLSRAGSVAKKVAGTKHFLASS